MAFPSNLSVASALIYPSRDDSTAAKRAKYFVVFNIKQDKPAAPDTDQGAIAFTVERMGARLAGSPLGAFLAGQVTLVPVPRHARLRKGALWPARRICEELKRAGIGEDIIPCLERKYAVAKSAFARPGERLGPRQHYESMSCDSSLLKPSRIILVDDVVTRGATLVACAGHISGVFPEAEVVAFALARVDQEARFENVNEMFSPKVETIRYEVSSRMLSRS